MANTDPRYIHETALRDLITTMSDYISNPIELLKDLKFDATKVSYMRNIAKTSKNLTLEFPVIVASSVPVDVAVMCAKAIERKAVTMLQMLFSAINITSSKDAIEYIQKFHTNIKMNGNIGIDDFIDLMDEYEESVNIEQRKEYKAVLEDFKRCTNFYLKDTINNRSLGDYKVDTVHGMNVIETPITKSYSSDESILEAKGNNPSSSKSNTATPSFDSRGAKYAKDALSNTFDTDYKKANEMIPSMMVIRFRTIDPSIQNPIDNYVVIGVKGKLHYVDSGDMINRLASKNMRNNDGLFNFIKATTREISFWKDFIFAVDKAKIDAIATSGRGSSSPIWKLLERRALKSRIRKWTGSANDAMAISTIIISKDEADTLLEEYKMDITKPSNIFSIFNDYNIMGFIIVDIPNEKCSILFDDGSTHFETLSFSHMERDNGTGEYKKIINLLTKVR